MIIQSDHRRELHVFFRKWPMMTIATNAPIFGVLRNGLSLSGGGRGGGGG